MGNGIFSIEQYVFFILIINSLWNNQIPVLPEWEEIFRHTHPIIISIMHYPNLGFAFGFFLLSFIFPVDLYTPETRIPAPEGSDHRDGYPSDGPCPQEKEGTRNHLCIIDLLADIDLMALSLRNEVRGYRRITANNVLEQETRRKVFDLICQNPGIDFSRLADLSGCNERTLRYHINRIAEERCITIFTKGKSFHFFENHSTFSDREQTVLAFSSSGQTARILSLIHNYPGITRRELADHLGIASPTVTRMIHTLAGEACIRLVKDGKYTRHYLMADTRRIISGIPPG